MPEQDPFNLTRFLQAQETAYESALKEIRRGRKLTHWMWYIFPQYAGLGFSSTSVFYAIKSLDEARAYLSHPVLGARLAECCDDSLVVHPWWSRRCGSVVFLALSSV